MLVISLWQRRSQTSLLEISFEHFETGLNQTNIISQNWGLTWAKREQLWRVFNFCNQTLNPLKTTWSFKPPKKTVILYFFIYQVLQYIHLWWLFNFAIHSKCPFSSCCPAGRTLIIWLLYTKLWNQVTSFWFSPLKIKSGWVLWCSKVQICKK